MSEKLATRYRKFGPDADVFVFAIPLIAKANSANWSRTLELLDQTLRSVLNQTDENFHVLIAANDDIRSLLPDDCRIELMVLNNMPKPDGGSSDPDHSWRNSDQIHKRQLMTITGQRLGAKYLMHLDSDDLVREDLVNMVRKNRPPVASVIRSGFVQNFVSGKVVRLPRSDILGAHAVQLTYDSFCGSSIILTYPDRPKMNWQFELIGQGHHNVWRNLKEKGLEVFELNEPMGVYRINTAVNVSMHTTNKKEQLAWVASIINTVESDGKMLSADELRLFGLPPTRAPDLKT